MKRLDLTGQKFGRWTVISVASHGCNTIYWKVHCECGTTKVVDGNELRRGRSASCGCSYNRGNLIHGMKGSPEYRSWNSMKGRCLKPSNVDYFRYGARGIKVCKRWKNSFINFYSDMGPRPQGTTLDRIDNLKGYSKDNCRWATTSTQARNRRTNKIVEWEGREFSQIDLCELYKISRTAFSERLRRGWSLEDALLEPIKKCQTLE